MGNTHAAVNNSAYGIDLDFIRAASAEGLIIGKLQTDGKLRRCPTVDHPNGENGAYWFNPESRCGWYQNWEMGGEDGQLWFSTAPDNRTEGEKLDAKLKANKEIESKAKARAAIAARVAREAPRTFAAANPTDCHRYLENKGVASNGLRIDADGVTLLVPVRDIDGNWQTLQRIAEDGSKKFIRGGKMKRGMFPIGDIDPDGVILIGEGFATMATLFEITGYACICAFNAGNIPLVAEIVHERYPNARICICCDDDYKSEAEGKGNAGIEKGRKAAEAIGCALAIPRVRGGSGSDFNDMSLDANEGISAVAEVINGALGAAVNGKVSKVATKSNPAPNKGGDATGNTIPDIEALAAEWGSLSAIEREIAVKSCAKSTGLSIKTVRAGVKEFVMARNAAEKRKNPDDNILDGCEPLPRGFRYRDEWVERLLPPDETGLEKWTRICSQIAISGSYRREDGDGWGYVVRVHTTDDTWNEVYVDAETGSDRDEVIKILSRNGMRHDPREKVAVKCIILMSEPVHKMRATTTLGFNGNAFVLHDDVIGDDRDRLIYNPGRKSNSPYSKSGTLAGWKDGVARLSDCNSRLQLGVMTAFAGPVIQLLGYQSGGFHIHGHSSGGKTTALVCGASVWGRGSVDNGGLASSWRVTSNGGESVAASRSATILPLDEVGQADGKAVSEMIYMLSQGEGKRRATRTGGEQRVSSWVLSLFSTGEISLADKIKEAGLKVMPGQTVRFIDLEADAGRGMGAIEETHEFDTPKEFVIAVASCATTDYGHAGPEFVRGMIADLDAIRRSIPKEVSRLAAEWTPEGAASQVGRVATRFAIVAASGELAIKLGVLPWINGSAIDVAKRMFKEWISGRGGTENQESRNAIEQIRDIIQKFRHSKFLVVNQKGDDVTLQEAHRPTETYGYIIGETVCILPETFENVFCKGFDKGRVASELDEKGLLHHGKERNLDKKVSLKSIGLGRPRCYVIDLSKLFDDAE
jgi:putative DNA primase/helicase